MKGSTANQGVVPLRTILRNFLNLVDNYEASVKDGLDVYDKEFQELKQFSENLKSDSAYFCKEGEKNVNRKKNRYKDILPFDYTRVILADYGDVPGSDYINANFIKGASGSSAYIACQGPLPHTVNDFWRMVVECEVQVIVMACNEQESGKHKCENYWVEEEAVEKELGQVTVWLKKCRQVCPDFLVRTMRIRYINSKGETEERNVCQFHYSAWPDHGVPTKVRPLLDMVRLIRDCQTSETLPVLVHCSAGCGRTGTICAIDYVWGLLRLGKLTPDFSLFCMVRDMRRQRIAMVQTKDQYVLVHKAVKELFEEQLRIIDSHPYANVDQNGLPLDIKVDLEEPTYETVEYLSNEQNTPSVLPPANRSLDAINPKLEKQVENHCKQHEKQNSKESKPNVTLYETDEIVAATLITTNEEKDEKESSDEKVNSSTSKVSPIRNALLRKPSIVKLKAFFEKSKDEKKSGSTQLSRAKSDVSSRFYSFNNIASALTSRGNSPTAKASLSGPLSSPTLSNEASSPPPQKPKLKPALLAKPALPVKRSKSLKLGKADTSSDICKPQTMNSTPQQFDQHTTSYETTTKSDFLNAKPTSTFSIVTNNPLKVCVKQVEIPKLQKVVSKSVKPESQIARTSDLRKVDSEPFKKPAIPPKMHLSKDNGVPVIKSISPRIKMGVAKEMEDVLQARKQSFKNTKLKKYDTVTPKSFAAANSGTALTRSQSHVWQPSKMQLPMRIFSDENIYQAGNVVDNLNSNTESLEKYNSSYRTSHDQSYDQTMNQSSHKRSSSLESSNSYLTKFSDLEYLKEKPIVRKRVPKTNPYTNYSPSAGNSKHYSKPVERNAIGQITYLNDNGPKDLPHLKLSLDGNRSRENSSESSSNTGTPRNSLPGTPTRTVDSSYTQILKTNLHDLSNNGNRVIGNGHLPPRSILKGSLSSTPSESDERLDSGRICTTVPSSSNNKIPVVGGPPKLNSIRIAVGVRERRNSFRQAVWKEEQSPLNGNQDIQDSPSNTLIFPTSSNRQFPVSSVSNGYPARSHKDYEPIWPEPKDTFSNHSNAGAKSFFISNDIRPSTSHFPANRSLNASNSTGFNYNSQSEDRIKIQPEFQNRFEEINNLLEELKAPSIQQSSSSRNHSQSKELLTYSEIDNPKTVKQEVVPNTSSTTNLKHARSLRTQRPQYQPGLSCFAFRKPSSFESITDQLHYEEYNLHNPKLTSFSSEINEMRRDTELTRESSGLKSRRTNDYVSLRQCHTSPTPEPRYDPHEANLKVSLIMPADTPIPPPRTKNKRFQEKNGKKVEDYSNLDDLKFPQNENHTSEWTGSGEVDSINLPEIVRCTNYSEDNQQASGSSTMQPTSPKSIFKALGLVQAKAANMRSRFAHWTEAKDKNNSAKLTKENDPKDEVQNEGGFSLPVTSAHSSQSRPKHQYL